MPTSSTVSVEHDVLTPHPQAGLVLAQTQRWLERAVIGLNLCPFAKAVHVKRQIRYAISGAETDEQLRDELVRELSRLAEADPEAHDTTLLIHPLVLTDFFDYTFFLDEADAAIRRMRLEGTVQIASFHPQYQFAGSAAGDIENFTNRSPFPMLHLLREASIDRAVAAFPEAELIFERNMDTMLQLGHEGWQLLWQDEAPAV